MCCCTHSCGRYVEIYPGLKFKLIKYNFIELVALVETSPAAQMSGIESFRKMLKAGVPRGAVEMRCQQAGFDPAMLDEQQVRTRSLTSCLKIYFDKLYK